MTKAEIITELAEGRVVEEICTNVAHARNLDQDLKDLAQHVYFVLLEYQEEKVLALWKAGTLRFFVARIVLNQYRCPRSAFRKEIREFGVMSTEINPETFAAVSVLMQPTGRHMGHVEARLF